MQHRKLVLDCCLAHKKSTHPRINGLLQVSLHQMPKYHPLNTCRLNHFETLPDVGGGGACPMETMQRLPLSSQSCVEQRKS